MQTRIPMTVAAARNYNGPGTQIVWRPSTTKVNAQNPDSDRAVLYHESDEEDVRCSALALKRTELKQKVKELL